MCQFLQPKKKNIHEKKVGIERRERWSKSQRKVGGKYVYGRKKSTF